MIKIAVCDDDPCQLRATAELIKKECASISAQIDIFSSGDELLCSVSSSDYRPDIAVLDIDMPGTGGIETGSRLNFLCPCCALIFLTAYLNYATEVYEVRHSYFVLKSQLRRRIPDALKKALQQLGQEEKLLIKDSSGSSVIPLKDVLYIERRLKKTIVNDVHGRSFSTYSKPDELLAHLNSRELIQVHQSYYINLNHVQSMSGDSFTLKDGSVIPLSRSRCRAARDAFYAFLSSGLK